MHRDEHNSLPTMSMMAMLRKIVATNGRAVRRTMPPSGWEVRAYPGSTLFWFPTRAGRGLVTRGFINDDGEITKLGLQALEAYRWIR